MSETCTVRPELIEFNKGTDSFLSIVAYPGANKGFRFTDTSYTTSVLSNIEDGLVFPTAAILLTLQPMSSMVTRLRFPH